eukprot:CAMPEP_0119016942 /NCGR_PEP_ID=MMETSP1176-20130426/14860_1 /TAXON_ID=265551 /ORGANISM="Synedropsis recta cf, Strain CCMP1620" /LENGTH=164 /DNA_ID=CAMNT_0006970515 /DNA_START=173 /DNA_END=667 /DNA_ORIENTATION=+
MTQTPDILFADVQYMGPSEGTEPEIIIDNLTDAPCFATTMATPVESTQHFVGLTRTTSSYTTPPPPDTSHMKKKRRRKKVRAGVIGGIAGLLIGGPLGAVVLGLGSARISKRISKKEEERIWTEYARVVEQQAACAVSMKINLPRARIVRTRTAELSEEILTEI